MFKKSDLIKLAKKYDRKLASELVTKVVDELMNQDTYKEKKRREVRKEVYKSLKFAISLVAPETHYKGTEEKPLKLDKKTAWNTAHELHSSNPKKYKYVRNALKDAYKQLRMLAFESDYMKIDFEHYIKDWFTTDCIGKKLKLNPFIRNPKTLTEYIQKYGEKKGKERFAKEQINNVA